MQQNIGHNKHFTESVSFLQLMDHDDLENMKLKATLFTGVFPPLSIS